MRFKAASCSVSFVLALAVVLAIPQIGATEVLTHSTTLSQDQVILKEISGAARVVVSDDSYDRLRTAGQPGLPFRVINIMLPQGEVVGSYEFTTSAPVVMKERADIAPAAAMTAEDGTVGQESGIAGPYAPGRVFPEQTGRYLGTGYLRGRAIASFAVFPMRIHDGSLSLTERVTINITTDPANTGNDVLVRERHRDKLDRGGDDSMSRLVENPKMAERYVFNGIRVATGKGGFQPTAYPSLEGSAVDYVIITTDALAAEYQRLADWKTAKGVPTVVRTTEWIAANTRNGVDLQETMRFFIQDAYAKWGISYVLLGGDTDILPPRFALTRFTGDMELPADMYFACLDGSWNDNHDEFWGEVPQDNPDLYAEVYVGRIPASDLSGVSTVIDKIIGYETPVDLAYTDRFLFLAEVLFPTSWTGGDPISLNGADFAEFIRATSLSGLPLDIVSMYETDNLYPGSVNENKQAALDSLEAGFNHVCAVGHGWRSNLSAADASILNADADGLGNTDGWSNLVLLQGSAAAYPFDCLAEHFLRNPTGGAVSVIGPNDVAFPNASFSYMSEYYDLLFQDDVAHIGEAFAASRLPLTPLAASTDGVDLYHHYVYTILADPEMPVSTRAVTQLDVTHVANVSLGSASVLVHVETEGQPVEAATVCLSKDGDDYQIGTTDSSGDVTIEFSAESPGSITVVATGFNVSRYQGSITVDPVAAALIRFDGLAVDDDTNGGSFGNGDGVVDAGETIDFTIELANTGGAPSDSCWLVLRTDDPMVTVLDSVAGVGVIASGGSQAALDPVRVAFDPGLPDGATVEFTLDIQDASNGMWEDSFKKVVHAPVLELMRLRVDDDPPLGDGDGVISANEEFLLYYEIKNYGTGAATGMNAELSDLDGAFTFFDSTDTYPDLGPLAYGENVSGFHIKESNTAVENRLGIAITDLLGHVYVDSFELRAPDPPSALTFDTSFGPDQLEIVWAESPSPDAVHYDVYRSESSGGPYALANVDLLDHTVYVDTGLSPNTAYYYVAVAVDVSGNQSVFSAEFATATGPPQLAGFPVAVSEQSTSSPAAGDVDGDGDLEVVVGGEHVLAWHHDGVELVDGDGNPSTSGVLNTLGDGFVAAIALGNLDAHPGVDIIAADLGTQSVYCMNYLGNSLPGWPQVAENGFRAAPSTGDLDGDGSLEVIAMDEAGVIYAWNADGSEYRDGDGDPITTGVFYRTPATTFHYQSPTLCDIDADGKDEIIVGTRVNTIYALNDDGSAAAGWPFVMGGEAAGSIAAGDVDGDGMPELVAHAKTSEVYLLNHDGTVSPGWPRFVSMNGPFFTPSPALADLDDDGTLEVIVAHHNSIESRIYVIDHDGGDYPGWPIVYSTDFTESSPTVIDVDGDSSLDIVLGDEGGSVFAWDLAGAMLLGFPILTGDAVRATPHLGDVDSDGDVDMVVHGWDMNVYVYDLTGAHQQGAAAWPTLHANVHRNGKYGFSVPTAIDNPSEEPPITEPALLQNYPNPFNPTTRIVYEVPAGAATNVSLVIYDVTGARVRTLVNDTKKPGRHAELWNGRDESGQAVASGVYFYRIAFEGFTATRKLVLLK